MIFCKLQAPQLPCYVYMFVAPLSLPLLVPLSALHQLLAERDWRNLAVFLVLAPGGVALHLALDVHVAKKADGVVDRGVRGYVDVGKEVDCIPVRMGGSRGSHKSCAEQESCKHSLHRRGRLVEYYVLVAGKVPGQFPGLKIQTWGAQSVCIG